MSHTELIDAIVGKNNPLFEIVFTLLTGDNITFYGELFLTITHSGKLLYALWDVVYTLRMKVNLILWKRLFNIKVLSDSSAIQITL